MPDKAENLDAIRSDGHRLYAFASFILGEVVASGEITAMPSETARFLSVSFNVGDETDCAYGYEVTLHDQSTPTLVKARTHIRSGDSITSSSIPVREFSRSKLFPIPGDTFKVWSAPRLHDKLVAADASFAPDWQTYTDQNEAPAPVACSGGHVAMRVDAGETFATVQMIGTTSYVVDPASNPANISHLYTYPTGVALASGSSATDPSPVLEVNVGEYMITHTVTDDDNGKSRTQYVNVRVHDDSDPPHEVLVENLSGTAEDGWNWTIQVLEGDTDLDAIPDGCLAILWTEEYINGVQQSFRGMTPGREHILGVGYVNRDTSAGNGEDGSSSIRFEVISPLARLKQITSYSKVMEENANPDAWSEFETPLRVKRAVLQIVAYYTTLVEAGFDFVVDEAFRDATYAPIYEPRGSFYDQLDRLSKAASARMICDRAGLFHLHTHPAFIELDDRAAVTTVFTLDEDDVRSYEFSRKHFDNVETVKASGFVGGASPQPVFSVSPGTAPAEALDAPTLDGLIVSAQYDLNAQCGMFYALQNMEFYDEDDNKHQAFDLRLTMRGSYSVLDFYKEYVEITIAGNKRGIDLTDRRFYPINVTETFDSGTSTTEVTLRMETYSRPGQTVVYSAENPPEYIPPEYIPPVWTPPGIPGGRLPPWNGVDQDPVKLVVLAANTNKAFIAAPWDSTSATQAWTEVSTSLSGSGLHLTADPYDYRRFFALTTDGLYRNDNLPGGGSWSQVASNTAMFGGGSYIGHNVIMSINRRGWIMVATGIQTVAVSFNYGVSWSLVAVDGGTPTPVTALSRFSVKIAASSNNSTASGVVYAAIGSGFSATDALYKTTDWGATWSLANADIAGVTTATPVISVPHVRLNGDANINDSSQELYYVEGSGNQGAVRFSNTAGTSWTSKFTINAGGSVIRVDGCEAGYNLMPFTHDSNILIYSTQFGMAYSSDAGDTRDFTSNVLSGASPSEWQCGVNGFGLHIGAMLGWNRGGTTGGLWWSLDAGATGVQCTLPSGVTLVANSQWLLDSFIAPG